VKVLPALETIFYGANLSKFLSAHQNTVLDILAWLPYGIIHFGAPFVCSIVMFIFGPPGTVPNFARSFGWMNVVGVTIQLLFPCSPPWYENKYGLAPADYSIPGSPAGLARLDRLFGIDLYTSKFTASPMVFGAFPSLHAGSATIEALFMGHVFPQYRVLFFLYTLWLWWATMYLSHHYAVDLVGGSLRTSRNPRAQERTTDHAPVAAVVFCINKSNFLPRRQAGKTFRWDYDYIDIGDEEPSHSLKGLHTDFGHELDDWAVGFWSSFSSGTLSPSDGHHFWDEETLGSGSEDTEFDV
jgi:membrane-associated phospholipid phosphatase